MPVAAMLSENGNESAVMRNSSALASKSTVLEHVLAVETIHLEPSSRYAPTMGRPHQSSSCRSKNIHKNTKNPTPSTEGFEHDNCNSRKRHQHRFQRFGPLCTSAVEASWQMQPAWKRAQASAPGGPEDWRTEASTACVSGARRPDCSGWPEELGWIVGHTGTCTRSLDGKLQRMAN